LNETIPTPAELAARWSLDPGVVYLNHGSFGACPKAVLAEQARLRERIELQPVQFFDRDLEGLLDAARRELARFVGARPEDLVFVPNATTGVNAVLRSFPFEPGDELLTTDHEYNACRNACDFVAARTGARVVVARVPFPTAGPDEAVQSILSHVTRRTRLALFDHVTSPTAVVLPAERLARELAAAGVLTLVDGAHAPGMLDLDVDGIGAAYYTGNCHKWLCAPKGAGFLWVRPDLRNGVRPTVISHGANAPVRDRTRFWLEFDWVGTVDPTAVLCVPEAIRFLGSLVPGGWPAVRERNRALALAARSVVAQALGVPLPCPDEMVGSMAALPIPPAPPGPPGSALYADPLQERLLADWGIEIPIIRWPAAPRRLVRLSAQLYNSIEQYEALGGALREVFPRGFGTSLT